MEPKEKIIKIIRHLSGQYSEFEVFNDWIQCLTLAIANNQERFHDETWKKREQLYMDTINKYSKESFLFSEMRELLVEAMEKHMGDILGEIFMEGDMGSKTNGQFFTPYKVNQAAAYLTASQMKCDENGIYRLYEPSCGAGGMIIAVAQCLNEKGIDYHKNLEVVAQDLDWKSVYMAYVQLSYYGIRAKVVQGDTLESKPDGNIPKERIFITPMKIWRI